MICLLIMLFLFYVNTVGHANNGYNVCNPHEKERPCYDNDVVC